MIDEVHQQVPAVDELVAQWPAASPGRSGALRRVMRCHHAARQGRTNRRACGDQLGVDGVWDRSGGRKQTVRLQSGARPARGDHWRPCAAVGGAIEGTRRDEGRDDDTDDRAQRQAQ